MSRVEAVDHGDRDRTDDSPPCRVVLFDFHTAGYHLEYVSRILGNVDDLSDATDLVYLTTETTPRHEEFLPEADVETLPDFRASTDDRSHPAYKRVAVRDALAYLDGSDYDVAFVPECDDILDYLHQYADRHGDLPRLVGMLTGQFFTEPTKHDQVTALLATPASERVVLTLHDTVFGRDWMARGIATTGVLATTPIGDGDRKSVETGLYSYVRPYALANCTRRDVFDHLMVYSEPAREYVTALDPEFAGESVSVIPDPTDPWRETFGDDLTREHALRELGLTDEGVVLLFFGMLRRDKGIDVLLDALDRYDGPPFTMVVAGEPVDVTEREVESAADDGTASVRAEFGFVPDEEVPLYFFAADGVVTPHRPVFGPESTSGPFQKACATGRPVIGPAFGTFQRRIEEWDLGVTFEPASADDLARTMATVVERDAEVFDPASMQSYARSHTYEEHARQVLQVALAAATR